MRVRPAARSTPLISFCAPTAHRTRMPPPTTPSCHRASPPSVPARRCPRLRRRTARPRSKLDGARARRRGHRSPPLTRPCSERTLVAATGSPALRGPLALGCYRPAHVAIVDPLWSPPRPHAAACLDRQATHATQPAPLWKLEICC
jgi:hypothetical protein